MPVKIYYEDTDCLGVVYHANYLKFFERGRTELIGRLGRPIGEWNAAGCNFVVYKMEITFHRAARLGDECEVVTHLSPQSPYRMAMAQRLLRGEELLTEALVQVVCVDASLELREIPEPLLRAAGELKSRTG
ncbi:MAG: YbgC/FadM family acyl-CoA thioesterase [Deltaproteobacteria bacterium]|nr:YbgC/FadM family acyl-CoA thioesterase [Deltaproteobacteria bacterium]